MVGNCSFSELGLRGQVVLITGAGRGLGRAYAEIISEAGASVVVQDAGVDEEGENPNPACAVEVADALKAKGRSALAVFETLGDFRSCSEVVAVAHGWMGRLDGVIHNAGLVIWRDPTNVDESLYRRMMGVASQAAYGLCVAALPIMRAQGYGRLVLTSSGWALRPSEGSQRLVLYAQAKTAQVGLAIALARNAGHSEICTNVIVPVAKTRTYNGAFRLAVWNLKLWRAPLLG